MVLMQFSANTVLKVRVGLGLGIGLGSGLAKPNPDPNPNPDPTSVLQELFSAEAQPSGGKFKSNKFKGIITAFCTGLDQLYEVLDNSSLHFVRCFKPNDAKKGGDWKDDVILRQLHTSGVLDALRVARTGYPDRMPFEEFFGMYSFVGGTRT